MPAGAGRQIFALPWYGRTLVGTTDNDYEGDIEHPQPGDDDVEYLLDAVNDFFGTELGRGDLVGAYAGVRPLLSTGDPKKSVDISRKAELYETSSGMLTITGGKLTTWRRMAKQTVDRMVEREGREAPCHTAEIPLGMTARPEDLEAPDGVGEEALEQLAFRYGHAARAVLKLAREDPKLARADRRGAPRPARRGGHRGPARAGADGRRRAAAPHPARPARGAAAARRQGRPPGRRGDGRRARLVAAAGEAGGRGLAGGGGRGRGRSAPPRRANNLRRMNKAELESKHLSELHALAADAGVERYRMLPRAELIEKLAGGDGGGSGGGSSQRSRPPRERPERSSRGGGRGRGGRGGGDRSSRGGGDRQPRGGRDRQPRGGGDRQPRGGDRQRRRPEAEGQRAARRASRRRPRRRRAAMRRRRRNAGAGAASARAPKRSAPAS